MGKLNQLQQKDFKLKFKMTGFVCLHGRSTTEIAKMPLEAVFALVTHSFKESQPTE